METTSSLLRDRSGVTVAPGDGVGRKGASVAVDVGIGVSEGNKVGDATATGVSKTASLN